jgi:hypothetical protein
MLRNTTNRAIDDYADTSALMPQAAIARLSASR